jgi:hypothetical protein
MSYPAQRLFHVAKTVFVAPYGVTTVATNPTAHGIDPAQAKIKPHVRFFVIIRAIEGASRQPRRSGSAFAIAAQHFRASIGDIASQHNAGCCGARGVGCGRGATVAVADRRQAGVKNPRTRQIFVTV